MRLRPAAVDREPRLRRAGLPGHDVCFDPGRYELQTIRGNVELPTPELFRKADGLVVAAGHGAAGKSLARRWPVAATRSWLKRMSATRPTSACFGRRRPAEVHAFIDLPLKLAAKAEGSLKALERKGCPGRDLDRIVDLIGFARFFVDQIDRLTHHCEIIKTGNQSWRFNNRT